MGRNKTRTGVRQEPTEPALPNYIKSHPEGFTVSVRAKPGSKVCFLQCLEMQNKGFRINHRKPSKAVASTSFQHMLIDGMNLQESDVCLCGSRDPCEPTPHVSREILPTEWRHAAQVRAIALTPDAVEVSIDAPAKEGEANEGIVLYLAEVLGVHKREVSLAVGTKSRDKVLLVKGLSVHDAFKRLQEAASSA